MQEMQDVHSAAHDLTLVATINRSAKRRFLAVPSDYHEALDAIKTRRVLVRIEPLA